MKIEQKKGFQPVVVTLESSEEVMALWALAQRALNSANTLPEEDKFASQIAGFCSRAAEKGAL